MEYEGIVGVAQRSDGWPGVIDLAIAHGELHRGDERLGRLNGRLRHTKVNAHESPPFKHPDNAVVLGCVSSGGKSDRRNPDGLVPARCAAVEDLEDPVGRVPKAPKRISDGTPSGRGQLRDTGQKLCILHEFPVLRVKAIDPLAKMESRYPIHQVLLNPAGGKPVTLAEDLEDGMAPVRIKSSDLA